MVARVVGRMVVLVVALRGSAEGQEREGQEDKKASHNRTIAPTRALAASLHFAMSLTEAKMEREIEKLMLEISDLQRSLAEKRTVSFKLAGYLPLMTASIAVLGFWVGQYEFNKQQDQRAQEFNQQQTQQFKSLTDAQKRDALAREQEFKKLFLAKQMETYFAISDCASLLATTHDDAVKKREKARFAELYHGNMIVVADEAVANEMKRFEQIYINYQHDMGLQNEAESASRVLSRACRESLARTWGVDLKSFNMQIEH
jgi:Tfp pilus assembly protein PilV